MKRLFVLTVSASLCAAAACNADRLPVEGIPELTPSTVYASPGGTVTFTVTCGETDVTGASTILLDGTGCGSVWTAPAEGTYIFSAEYLGRPANKVKVRVNATGEPESPEKTVLIHKFTATWCAFCPDFTKVLDRIDEEYPGRTEVISVHGNDKLTVLNGKQLIDLAGIDSYPAAWVDCRTRPNADYDGVSAAIEESLGQHPSGCIVDVMTGTDGSTVTVDAQIDVRAAGDYRICALVTEDNIMFDGECTEPSKTYNHVLRQYATSVQGDDMGHLEPGVHYRSFSFRKAANWKDADCSFIVYVLRQDGDGYVVDNVGRSGI